MKLRELIKKYYRYHNISHFSGNNYSKNYVKFLERQVINLENKKAQSTKKKK